MNTQEIESNIYSNAKDLKTGGTVNILGYNKGWVEVEIGDTADIYKIRAKHLELLNKDEEQKEAVESNNALNQETKDEESLVHTAKCPSCGHEWETKKYENFICPNCKHCFFVKLNPNMENYVVGLDATESGRDTVDIDDYVAKTLRGMNAIDAQTKVVDIFLVDIATDKRFNKKDSEAFETFVESLDEEYDARATLEEFLTNKYGHLNMGMHRMCLGNLLRGALKRQGEQDK